MADLPIVPERFKLVVRDERSRKQMSVVTKQLGRDDVDEVVNACDAGREGELIFAYLYEKAKAQEAGQAAVAELDDERGDEGGVRLAAARPRSSRALEQAARSRSEADWIVGMNATRAATIRLRSSFDGAVSLGRVQTPTLAIVARREEEIRAFKPEPYWLVDATFGADRSERSRGRRARLRRAASTPARKPRHQRPRSAPSRRRRRSSRACEGQPGTITKLEKKEQREKAPMLYDLTTLQREANNRFGFSARRTLAAAQRLYEEHKALTYPRTNSRYLTTDMVERDQADRRARRRAARSTRKGADYVIGLDVLPLARVVNDEKVTDHHAIIPTRSEHNRSRRWTPTTGASTTWSCGASWRSSTPRRCSRTRASRRPSPAAGPHVFRTRGKLLLVPGWRGVYGEVAADASGARARRGGRGRRPAAAAAAATASRCRRVEIERDAQGNQAAAPLQRRLAAGRDGDRRQARRRRRAARGDEGLGDRHAGDARGDHRAADHGRLRRARRPRAGRDREGPERDPPARRARADLARTDRQLGAAARQDRARRGLARAVHERHRRLRRARPSRSSTRRSRTCASRARSLGPCPVCGHEIVENRKGYSCWSREDPGCGFVIWKAKAGKQLPLAIARELIKTGYTAQAGDRLPRPQRAQLPRAPGAAADRRGQMARRVRRAVGARRAPSRPRPRPSDALPRPPRATAAAGRAPRSAA